MGSFFRKAFKFIYLIRNASYRKALQLGVAAAVEHERLLSLLDCNTIVDIGANRGQFALVARACFPQADIISFEPLPEPALIFSRVFGRDDATKLHKSAIGPIKNKCVMHVSARDDSSSLLPISSLQNDIFPGTGEKTTLEVDVGLLSDFVNKSQITAPAMLKLDVQGFELDALKGCETLLDDFKWVYCECSFVELYTGQKLASDVIGWLSGKGFLVEGVYNPTYDGEGRAVQADLLFSKVH